jgi:hypothetical protein
MQWFKHDTDSITDAKIKKLIFRFGAEGYAIYFHCLELIAGNVNDNNITFNLEHDAEIIADNLKIKGESDLSAIDKVNNIMSYIVQLGLFQEHNDHIFCFKMIKRMDQSMTSNSRLRDMIGNAKKNHDSIMMKPDFIMQEEKRKEEKRKEEKRIEKNNNTLPVKTGAVKKVELYFEKKLTTDWDGNELSDDCHEDLNIKVCIDNLKQKFYAETSMNFNVPNSEIAMFTTACKDYFKSCDQSSYWKAVDTLISCIRVRWRESDKQWIPDFKTIKYIVKNADKYYPDLMRS